MMPDVLYGWEPREMARSTENLAYAYGRVPPRCPRTAINSQ